MAIAIFEIWACFHACCVEGAGHHLILLNNRSELCWFYVGGNKPEKVLSPRVW